MHPLPLTAALGRQLRREGRRQTQKIDRKKTENQEEKSKFKKLKTWLHAQPIETINLAGSRFRRAPHRFWESSRALAERGNARS